MALSRLPLHTLKEGTLEPLFLCMVLNLVLFRT